MGFVFWVTAKTSLVESLLPALYLSNVGYNFFLVVVFDVSVTLGLIRIYTKKAIEDLGSA